MSNLTLEKEDLLRSIRERIEMKIRQAKTRYWDEEGNEITEVNALNEVNELNEVIEKLKKAAAAAPNNLVIANLRQFIPYSDSAYIEHVNRYLDKHLFCI